MPRFPCLQIQVLKKGNIWISHKRNIKKFSCVFQIEQSWLFKWKLQCFFGKKEHSARLASWYFRQASRNWMELSTQMREPEPGSIDNQDELLRQSNAGCDKKLEFTGGKRATSISFSIQDWNVVTPMWIHRATCALRVFAQSENFSYV